MVQEVIKTATKSRIKFAIRGGGHSIVPGAASINDGILIDMSGMNSIQYNELKETVTIGSGLRWRDVHSALNSHNRTVVGSRDLDVGVAGLSLGGGLSYFTEKYGMVCDNILNFEVRIRSTSVVNGG
jgi:FAD/FMN-containing dehydrogenase